MDFAIPYSLGILTVILFGMLVNIVYGWLDSDYKKAVNQTITAVYLILVWIIVCLIDQTAAAKFSYLVMLTIVGIVGLAITEKNAE